MSRVLSMIFTVWVFVSVLLAVWSLAKYAAHKDSTLKLLSDRIFAAVLWPMSLVAAGGNFRTVWRFFTKTEVNQNVQR